MHTTCLNLRNRLFPLFFDQLEDGRVPMKRSPVLLACERFVEAAVPGRNVIVFAKSTAFAIDALRAGLFVAWLADSKGHISNLSFTERLRVG